MYHPLGCQKGTRLGTSSSRDILVNETVPVSVVLDLRIAHDRFGSSSDPSLNGNLHYPNNIDGSLIETTDDKIRKYHTDYNNNPPHCVSFMSSIPSTSGRLHSEFDRLLFLQSHRETDHFFASSGVQLAETDRGLFHFHRRITLKLDGTPIISKSHTHPSHSQTSRSLTSSLSLGVPVPRATQCLCGM